ncbi:MAG: SH3 domain-containing protein, partial [Fusobacterium sp.]
MSIKKKLLIGLLFTMTTLSFSSTVKAVYDNKISPNVKTNIKYKGSDLPKLLDYVFIKTVTGNIRKKPSTGSGIILKAPFNSKFRALEKIQVRKSIWYKVQVGNQIGYVSGGIVRFKQFRFEKMVGSIKDLESFININKKKGLKLVSTHSYKPNPYNEEMNRRKDKYG